jgi:hypothetical protein
VGVLAGSRPRRRAVRSSTTGQVLLRDAIARGGPPADSFISPLDLVEIGLLADDAKEQHAMQTGGAPVAAK